MILQLSFILGFAWKRVRIIAEEGAIDEWSYAIKNKQKTERFAQLGLSNLFLI